MFSCLFYFTLWLVLYISCIRHFPCPLTSWRLSSISSKIIIILLFTFRFISHLECYSLRSEVQCQNGFSFFLFFYFVKKQNLAPFRYIFLPKDQSVTFVKNRLSYIHGSFCLFWPLSFFPALHQDKSVSVLTLQHALYLYLSPQVQFWFHRTISNILSSLHFLMVIGRLCEHWF